MARLRYNWLTTTLGAALTNSATSVTFGAALTHSGGTAVPTITGSDYIPLTILTSAGAVSEIVYLTAYTSGATSGTITRAQEGTAGVAHSSGDKVINSATAADLTYPRDVDNPSDPSWGAASAYDVEFDADGTSLPAGWSWFNQGTSTYEQKFGAGIITPQVGGAGTDGGQRMIVRALPTESAWSARVKLGNGPTITQWTMTGLVLRDSVTGKYTTFTRKGGSTAVTEQEFITAHNWSATETYAGASGDLNVRATPNVRYLRIDKTSGGTFNLLVSSDGIAWTPVQSGRAAYSAYDQIGLLATAPGAGVAGNEHSFHWFRVR